MATFALRAQRPLRAAVAAARRTRPWWIVFALLIAPASAQIELPAGDPYETIAVSADHASRWQQGTYEVWLLAGNCTVQQGPTTARGSDAVLWIDRGDASHAAATKLIAYLEGDVTVRHGSGRQEQALTDRTWLGRFHSFAPIQMRVPVAAPKPAVKPAIYRRSIEARDPDRRRTVQPAQFAPLDQPLRNPPPIGGAEPGARRIRVFPRSSTPVQAKWLPSRTSDEWIAVINSGVNMIVDGVDELGKIDVATDRIVIWTQGAEPDLTGQRQQKGDVPLEIYMEGNIVFRQGDRVVYAKSMYYNVTDEYGVVLQAELLTPVPQYQGLLRLKADVLQQLNRQQFQAHGAAMTSSRLGVPRYWFQSQNVAFQDVQQPLLDPFTGAAAVDPVTGDTAVDHQLLASSRHNFLYVGGLPVLYWPTLATDLTTPTYYIKRLSIHDDSVFGTQLRTAWNMYHLLGWRNPPVGTDWSVSADLLSERGIGLGTTFGYQRTGLLGCPGPSLGFLDAWGIKDEGVDNLGRGRRAVPPDQDYRGRLRWQHRHLLPGGYRISAEAGLISDRNFLEEYYEHEWDRLKDQTTGVELKRLVENTSWSIAADYRVNDFFTQTNALPRFDHFLIGQSVFGDHLTWHAHSHVGYAQLETADQTAPAFPDMGIPLAWERDTTGPPGVPYSKREGIVAATRHELDLPVQLGPVKAVPYVLGELAHWGEDRDGTDVTRAFGQTGVRASLPMWKANPNVQSPLLNLNGLAHKVVFDAEFLWADTNEDMDRLALYNPLDDDSVEHFRRRFVTTTFGGTLPGQFDERYYALRTAMQSNVTAPVTEIADDLMLFRVGARQRWQTKRGMPGSERIIDWIVLDVGGTVFPKADRDNFGEVLGLVNYDFRWHVGDRLTLLSDGYYDFFGDGLRMTTIGGMISRPERGSLYLGFRSLEGPVSSSIVGAAVNYRMSEKWIAGLSTSVDLGATGNIGQRLQFTRVGESLLLSVGMTVNSARDNVGVHVGLEPRFLPNSRLGRVNGVAIPPAGAFGLE